MKDYSIYELRKISDSYNKVLAESVENFDHSPSITELNPSNDQIPSISADFCKKWYLLFNEWYFGGRLPKGIKIRAYNFTSDKKTLGYAHYEYKYNHNGVRSVYPTGIDLNTIYGFSEYQLFDTLIHEMIHILDFNDFPEHYVDRNYKCHGVWFKNECSRLNQYGWTISTYDKTGAKWSSEYFNSKIAKNKESGKGPLIGFIEKDNGSFFITKTDMKNYTKNANGCILQASKYPSKIVRIHYYEIGGCKFATFKNYQSYWKSKLAEDSKVIDIYKQKKYIGDEPFIVVTPDKSASEKNQTELELENIESNYKKIVKGVLLAMCSSLYDTAYSKYDNYDSYSNGEVDAESTEMNVGEYTVPAFKTLDGRKLNIKLSSGDYSEGNSPRITFDSYDGIYEIEMKSGESMNGPTVRGELASVIYDFENIKDHAEYMVPSRFDGEWGSMDYRDGIYAPKVVLSQLSDVKGMTEIASRIVSHFIDSMKAKIASVGESIINEDKDEDSYETGFHLADDYAREMYDKLSKEGIPFTISKIDDSTVDVGIW